MGPSQPVTAGRAPVAESEQGAEPSCLVLGQLGPLAQAKSQQRRLAVQWCFFLCPGLLYLRKVMRAWVGTLLGAGGLHLLALALGSELSKGTCLGTPGAHCLLLTSTLGLWLRCDLRSLPFDRSGGDGERYQLRSSAEPSKIHLVSAAPCISACNSPSALPRKDTWSREHGVGPQFDLIPVT